MRIEVQLSLAESFAVSTAALGLDLACEINYAGELTVASMNIPDEDILEWWPARDEFREELRQLGVPARVARDLVLTIWRVLEPLKDKVQSTRRSFLERTT